MKHNKELCIACSAPMKKAYINYKGLKLEARECIKCKKKIFTEDLTMKVISQLESKRLENEYVKRPIKVGHSWGMTFPKEVADVFNLNEAKTKIKIHPNVVKGIIEISVK
mgnify:CR=1 FL=1